VPKGGRDAGEVGLFGSELAANRLRLGLTQDELGRRMHFSASMVSAVENGQAPSLEFAQAADRVFGTPESFERMQRYFRTLQLPSWFRPYAETERTATQIRSWQLSFVDGLLQTEEYARAMLSRKPNASDEEIEVLVAARMERQAILRRERPPLLWFVLDEAVLHRRMGSSKIMHGQLEHVAEAARMPNVHVEVVPYSAGGHYALAGGFTLVQQEDRLVGYQECIVDGYMVERPEDVTTLALAFDTVRGEAIPTRASRDLIEKRAEEYGSD
jgi:transcriptional regulator with XRE-family HTH domain